MNFYPAFAKSLKGGGRVRTASESAKGQKLFHHWPLQPLKYQIKLFGIISTSTLQFVWKVYRSLVSEIRITIAELSASITLLKGPIHGLRKIMYESFRNES